MPFTITIVCDETPGIREFELALEAAAWATARWYAAEVKAGHEPPCCLECADVCYLPDTPSETGATFRTGGELVKARNASCGEIAAWYLGVARAKRNFAQVGRIRGKRIRPEEIHTDVVLTNGRVLDPSRELRRC